ncbi:MAG TPA: hypothetical protein VF519_13590 [Mycobacteriales bacterium]|jgi:hypothetical protein
MTEARVTLGAAAAVVWVLALWAGLVPAQTDLGRSCGVPLRQAFRSTGEADCFERTQERAGSALMWTVVALPLSFGFVALQRYE